MAKFPERKERRNTLVVIVGPTASGKSDLAVELAKQYSGEIISADSRQVYRGLDIGSGKITKKMMMGIPHHLLDVAPPKRKFTVAQYQKLALDAITKIHVQGNLPILVGGTPFYIYSVVDGYILPAVRPNKLLREKLEKLSAEVLFARLQKLDPARAKTLQQSSGQDKNKRRLIRALEIITTSGAPVPQLQKTTHPFDILLLGIKKPPEELTKNIHKRLLSRLNKGMIEEVSNLHAAKLSWKRLEEFGLEYRFVAQYLQQKISYEEMVSVIQKESENFARRQMTWFKKDPRIHWITSSQEAEKLIRGFIVNK